MELIIYANNKVVMGMCQMTIVESWELNLKIHIPFYPHMNRISKHYQSYKL